jgi:hypothetical protein
MLDVVGIGNKTFRVTGIGTGLDGELCDMTKIQKIEDEWFIVDDFPLKLSSTFLAEVLDLMFVADNLDEHQKVRFSF